MLIEAAPVLVRVTFCGALMLCRRWLVKVSVSGESTTVGVELTPVPVSVDDIADDAELNVALTVAERVPAAAGVNVTLMLQEAPAATLAQLFVCEKSAAFVP